ncbi:hypothetical protein GUITHDRAFT_153249 [Guillardia theta CCMP2712]|uniref:Uncharacterized protein n=1 Tax=Guillardia theta (strain CCMP2712) TaxID=905079 RepID=L1J4F4_GUITC|nr:hypothetical protein GUITHDRAFT_153249 [Guillardia theta CCMP2712]EKX43376.1 hypothetical protein GUITHDRAFT_153249 [Guillardia theta CCMP2712]|eukprot:XP_005830356.1 hypothetical protein GUITHDRAFT_153249 [Guillardia theta CCMP2712]
MFFGFNVFDPSHSPAVNAHQESYNSGFTSSALGQKKSKWGAASGSKSLAQSMRVFDESFKGAY